MPRAADAKVWNEDLVKAYIDYQRKAYAHFVEQQKLARENTPEFLRIPAIPAVFLTSRLFQKLGFPPYRRQREAQSAISSHVAETITGVRVVKAFCAEGRELTRLEKMQTTYRKAFSSLFMTACNSRASAPTASIVMRPRRSASRSSARTK